MRIIKEIINMIIAFFLCFVIIGGFVIILFSKTMLKEEYVLSQISENGYYEKVEADLKNGFEEYQYQSGFPAEIFENLLAKEMIKEEIDSIVHHIYNGTEVVSHTSTIEEQLSKNIEQYLNDNQIALKAEQQKNIDDFKKIIVDVYENKISMTTNYIDPITKLRVKIDNLIGFAKIGLAFVLIVILLMILIINMRTIEEIFSTIGVSFLSSGILFQLVHFVIVKHIDIENILLLSHSFSSLVREIVQDILSKFTYFGILFIGIGIVSIMIGAYHKNKE